VAALRVVVVSPQPDSVAHRCLRAEGVRHDRRVLLKSEDYGQVLAALWRSGDGFVLIEDDVAPWPGAVHELVRCPVAWCMHDYAIGGGVMITSCSHAGLGILKVSAALTQLDLELGERWAGIDWRQLDQPVNAAIAELTGLPYGHVHEPPVAHAQGFRP
jgi:hypothetical protein